MKKRKIGWLGLGLALTSTAVWLIFWKLTGWLPWGYGPESIEISRLWDAIFFVPWTWALWLVYPELGERAIITAKLSAQLKQANLRSGIFAGVAIQAVFDYFTQQSSLWWWYGEIAFTYSWLVLFVFVFTDNKLCHEHSSYRIPGIALGLALGSLIVGGLFPGGICLLPAILIALVFKARS